MTTTTSFRQWLFTRLKGSPFSTQAMADHQVDAFAKRLGVDPELLLEARAEVRVERHAAGLRSPKIHYKLRTDPRDRYQRLYQYHLYMPEVVFYAWADECKFRGVKGSLLLRSLIHDYLTSDREIHPLSGWFWNGKKLKMGDSGERAKFLERAVVTHGAKRAIIRRANLIGCTPTALVRALATEALHGLHRDILLIEASAMWDDEERYNLGGKPSS